MSCRAAGWQLSEVVNRRRRGTNSAKTPAGESMRVVMAASGIVQLMTVIMSGNLPSAQSHRTVAIYLQNPLIDPRQRQRRSNRLKRSEKISEAEAWRKR